MFIDVNKFHLDDMFKSPCDAYSKEVDVVVYVYSYPNLDTKFVNRYYINKKTGRVIYVSLQGLDDVKAPLLSSDVVEKDYAWTLEHTEQKGEK